MQQFVHNLKQGWELLRSDDSRESVAAIVILVVTLGPVAWQLWQLRREVKR